MTNRVSETISDETLDRIIQIESAGRPAAKARTSSATGLGQFLNSTWLATVQRHRPDLMTGKTQGQVLAMRLDPKCSIEMLARFTEDNAAAIPGDRDADGDLYLAHFSGVGVAKRLFRAPADASASDYFSAAAIAANRSILEGKTAGEVRSWAESKMRKAGGRGWVAKYWADGVPRAAPTSPPRDENPDEEWTYENPKPDKTGITEGAQAAGGLTLLGIATMIWEKVSELPESAWGLIATLAAKPYFWAMLAAVCAVGFVWWKRRQVKKEGLA